MLPATETTVYQRSADVPYLLMDSQQEVERLARQHNAIKRLLNGNYAYKLNQPRRILEVGTGPGAWLLEMAAEFPECQFIGIDIVPYLSDTPLPPNVKFQVVNILDGKSSNNEATQPLIIPSDVGNVGLPFPDNSFDYVHQRLMCAAIPTAAWPRVLDELVRVCTPSGVIELFDSDAMLRNAGPYASEINHWFAEALRARHIRLTHLAELGRQLHRRADVRMLRAEQVPYPTGSWSGEVGRVCLENATAMIWNLRERLITAGLITDERLAEMLGRLDDECNAHCSYALMYLYILRKH